MCPEDGCSMFLLNIGIQPEDHYLKSKECLKYDAKRRIIIFLQDALSIEE
jgi:hypothetical protein